METPHMFTGINKKIPNQPSNPINVHALIGKIVIFIIIIILAGYAVISMLNILIKVKGNWKEIQFAYNQPAIVKTVMTQYQTKSDAMEAEFLNETPEIASAAASATPTNVPTPTDQTYYKTPLK